MKKRHALWALALTAMAWSSQVLAQHFPDKPIQIIVPVAAGGGTDLLARTLGQKVGELLGQSVVVENRLGAGGNIGVQAVAKAKPDGYTLLLSPATIALNVAVYRKLPYDLLKDLQTVTLVGQTGVVLVTHPSFKARQVSEFVEQAREKPGELNYGSAGLGSPQHLQAEFFNQLVSVKTNHIPYKGQSQAMNDLVGGQLNYMFSPIQNALPFIRQDRIRALAVASAQRHPALPNVPTLAEAGLAGVEAAGWNGLFVPASTPPAVIQRLQQETAKVMASPAWRSQAQSMGYDLGGESPQEFAQFIRQEIQKWSRVIQDARIRIE